MLERDELIERICGLEDDDLHELNKCYEEVIGSGKLNYMTELNSEIKDLLKWHLDGYNSYRIGEIFQDAVENKDFDYKDNYFVFDDTFDIYSYEFVIDYIESRQCEYEIEDIADYMIDNDEYFDLENLFEED